MTLRVPAKVLMIIYTCGHMIFYDMALSTGKQRRHMIRISIMQHVEDRPHCLTAYVLIGSPHSRVLGFMFTYKTVNEKHKLVQFINNN